MKTISIRLVNGTLYTTEVEEQHLKRLLNILRRPVRDAFVVLDNTALMILINIGNIASVEISDPAPPDPEKLPRGASAVTPKL